MVLAIIFQSPVFDAAVQQFIVRDCEMDWLACRMIKSQCRMPILLFCLLFVILLNRSLKSCMDHKVFFAGNLVQYFSLLLNAAGI
jgi:hypothetical protein